MKYAVACAAAILTLAGCSGHREPRTATSTATQPAAETATGTETAAETAVTSLAQPRVEGKYRMLLRQLAVDEDRQAYGDFQDFGFSSIVEYAGHTGLPPGYWVYVRPYWYIWRDNLDLPYARCDYAPEQATGKPNARLGKLAGNAWCPLTPDAAFEWLLLEFPADVQAARIHISEPFGGGAVVKVSAFTAQGTEETVWSGLDPAIDEEAEGKCVLPLELTVPINRVRLWLDTRGVPGWNVIDAVGLEAEDGAITWAHAAEASSTWAEPVPGRLEAHRGRPY